MPDSMEGGLLKKYPEDSLLHIIEFFLLQQGNSSDKIIAIMVALFIYYGEDNSL